MYDFLSVYVVCMFEYKYVWMCMYFNEWRLRLGLYGMYVCMYEYVNENSMFE